MTPRGKVSVAAVVALLLAGITASAPSAAVPSLDPLKLRRYGFVSDYYKKWPNGPNPTGDPGYFPINVWMQDPSNLHDGVQVGKAYQDIGVDTDLGLWDDEWWYLRKEGLYETNWRAYVSPQRVSAVLGDPAHARNYVGYLVADEPDMNKVYGDVFHPEFQPSAILAASNDIRAKDPSRPTYLNFGAWMGTPGGGVGYGYIEKSYEEDMRTYCSAADIASADFYGWTHPDRDARRGAWSYGTVIDTMRKWCGQDKPLYGFVETGHPHTQGDSITVDQLEQAIWNLVVHGATGIDYFAHSFHPDGTGEYFSMLTRPEISARAKQVNSRLRELAPVLNSHSQPGLAVTSTNGIPVTAMYKIHNGSKYVVSQADGNEQHPGSGATTAIFRIPVRAGTATVVGENRTVPITNGQIVDNYSPYQSHIYRF